MREAAHTPRPPFEALVVALDGLLLRLVRDVRASGLIARHGGEIRQRLIGLDAAESQRQCANACLKKGNRSEGVQPYAASGSGALSVVGCTGGSSDGDDVPER